MPNKMNLTRCCLILEWNVKQGCVHIFLIGLSVMIRLAMVHSSQDHGLGSSQQSHLAQRLQVPASIAYSSQDIASVERETLEALPASPSKVPP